MQKVAAYLLERLDGMNWPEARTAEAASIRSRVEGWLRSKGADTSVSSGTYLAEDHSRATFTIDEATDGARTWFMARLQEVSTAGRRFVAAVSVTNGSDRVSVYASLEVGSDETAVQPLLFDPRSPKIIRTLLSAPGRWFHGFSELRPLMRVSGFEPGDALAAEIRHSERTVPVVVISESPDGLALPGLDGALAYDLQGLANVVVVDGDASWGLTDHLGARLSCFSGAVRLYWPRLQTSESPFRHPLWTAVRLRSEASDEASVLDRFRRQLRTAIMNASALSVAATHEIYTIRDSASRRVFTDLRERAKSAREYSELSDLYAKENDDLRKVNSELRLEIESLAAKMATLESDKKALVAHLALAKGAHGEAQAADEIAPDDVTAAEDAGKPQRGEVRFYKKTYSRPEYDVLVRTKDCSHNRWQGGHSADKAKKGVARLEGLDTWKNFQHCGSCTGGGLWRVVW